MTAASGKQQCPHCGSNWLVDHQPAKRVGAALGAFAGIAGWAASTASAAEAGAVLGAVAGPVGALLGLVGGAVLTCMVATSAGGLIGARLGELLDGNLLDTVRCQACLRRINRSTIA